MSLLRVVIEPHLCTADGVCAELCPELFEIRQDGIAIVRRSAAEFVTGTTIAAIVRASADTLARAREAALACPGECIHFRDADLSKAG
jgi:ferredoxin